jgi:hypothetical protein
MIKYFCDCCKEEKKSLNKIEYYCHIDDYFKGRNLSSAYVDNEENAVSGRSNKLQVCNKCYNKIMYSMMEKAIELGFEIKKEHSHSLID